MVAQTGTNEIQTQTAKPPPRNTGGEDGIAIGFGLLGGLLFTAANLAGAFLLVSQPAVAWTLLACAWAIYPPVFGVLMWMGAATRQQT